MKCAQCDEHEWSPKHSGPPPGYTMDWHRWVMSPLDAESIRLGELAEAALREAGEP